MNGFVFRRRVGTLRAGDTIVVVPHLLVKSIARVAMFPGYRSLHVTDGMRTVMHCSQRVSVLPCLWERE